MTNNPEGVAANIEVDFDAYDKLPKAAKMALAEGTENYNTLAILRIGRQGSYSAREYVLEIGDIMREVTRRAAIRHYGKSHPQAADDCNWPIHLEPRRLQRR